jgi:cytochrome c oxidase subunit III
MREAGTTEEVELQEIVPSPGGPAAAGPGADGGDEGGGAPRQPARLYLTGLTMGLAAILMFFMALTSAYVVRKGLGNDWRTLGLPPVLWINTLVLLASSATIYRARRRLARLDLAGFRHWWGVTIALGLLFLLGQLLAWRQLVHQGVYLATNPSSSFFYVLTAAHGAHLLGGIVALLVVGLRPWRRARMTRSTAAELASIYWHFMDGLWVFIFLLLHLGR